MLAYSRTTAVKVDLYDQILRTFHILSLDSVTKCLK
ncbi:hypothetical protein MNBD_ALPHA01-1555 [hydrothermal vent metagenome]|uniref:Uncharacterized protein n=1 Tax=hydrothermal vent metagenome TaxID=652676 RepID=A0A3B0RHQ6_9ZZZZ